MSCTIYGGKTLNNMDIDDMVDDNRDYVYRYPKDEDFFVRLSGTREDISQDQRPALAVFHTEAPFIPLYAVELEGTYDVYMDKYGCLRGDQMEKPVNDLWKIMDTLSLERLKEFMKEQIHLN